MTESISGAGRFRAVSFDVGETLVRPYPSFPTAIARLCARAGLVLAPEQSARIDQMLAEKLLAHQGRGRGFSTSVEASRGFWVGLYRDFLAEIGVADGALGTLPDYLYDGFTQTENYRLFDDSWATVEELRRRGFVVGVLSNWEDWLVRLLADMGLDRLLDFQVISGVLGIEKPDPRIYAAAIAAANVSPDEILHVGDSYQTDVRGAREAGLTPVLLDRLGRRTDVDCLRVKSLLDLTRPDNPAGALLTSPRTGARA